MTECLTHAFHDIKLHPAASRFLSHALMCLHMPLRTTHKHRLGAHC